MKKMISLEIKRALFNKKMLISLIVGMLISGHQIWLYLHTNDVGNMKQMVGYFEEQAMDAPDYLWSAWIGESGMLFNGFLFFLILPLLAAFPHSNSYMLDEKNGYLKSVFTRTKKKNYYFAKWIATFFSGGLAVIIPLILNFLFFMTLFQIIGPYPETAHAGITDISTLSHLFYSTPFLYVGLFFIIIFIFAGIYATLSLIVTFFTDYSFIIFSFPFLIILFGTMILDLADLSFLSPQEFLYPFQAKISLPLLVLEMCSFLILSLFSYLHFGMRGTD